MISIIMPSYLGPYKSAAKNREQKIVRAIRSAQAQTYEDWELIVISDGCDKTVQIVREIHDSRIRLYKIPKQPTWSGEVRNSGIRLAMGNYCLYLDIDDAFAPEHLAEIAPHLKGKAWYWMDDWVYRKESKDFRHRKCDINKAGKCGTSNIIHKPAFALWQSKDNYAHDWNFINNLKGASKDYGYIKAGRYLVCHVPGRCDI